MSNNILIIGHAQHGKDTVAEMLFHHFRLNFESSSVAASRIFLFDILKKKYGYTTPQECFLDRIHHRTEWHDLICEYNYYDKAKLAKEILKTSNIYVGMRSNVEVEACQEQKLFKLIIGVYDPRKSEENKGSFDINLWEKADVVIPNALGLSELTDKVVRLSPLLISPLLISLTQSTSHAY